MDTTLPPRYQARVEAILQKTYDEHGVKGDAWGVKPDGNCSYQQGCAIGKSMSPEVAKIADNSGYGYIKPLLSVGDAAGMIAEELFGSRDLPPEKVIQVLAELQSIHDNFASDNFDQPAEEGVYRAAYREQLEKLASFWKLNLTRYEPEKS